MRGTIYPSLFWEAPRGNENNPEGSLSFFYFWCEFILTNYKMRKILLSMLLVVAITVAYGQQVPRDMVIVEIGTGT